MTDTERVVGDCGVYEQGQRLPGRVPLSQVSLFLGESFVVTVRHGDSTILGHVRKELDNGHLANGRFDPTELHGPTAVLYRAADLMVDQYGEVISAWAAIALVPTAIAGIYGMNFDHMPELRWRFGYLMVLALIAAVCLFLHRLFRRNGWL